MPVEAPPLHGADRISKAGREWSVKGHALAGRDPIVPTSWADTCDKGRSTRALPESEGEAVGGGQEYLPGTRATGEGGRVRQSRRRNEDPIPKFMKTGRTAACPRRGRACLPAVAGRSYTPARDGDSQKRDRRRVGFSLRPAPCITRSWRRGAGSPVRVRAVGTASLRAIDPRSMRVGCLLCVRFFFESGAARCFAAGACSAGGVV